MAAIKQIATNETEQKQSVFSLMNVVHHSPKGVVTEEDITLWTQAGIIPLNTPVEQVLLFARICAETDLSPSRRQICLIKMYDTSLKMDKFITYVTNDGLRTLINREGIYVGCEPTYFNVRSNGSFDLFTDVAENLQKHGAFPLTCTFTGYATNKKGQKMTFTKTVAFNEFYKGNVFSWQKMPLQMIEKTAKSFVYKEMLGDKMSGLNIEAEIDGTQPVLMDDKHTFQVNGDDITNEAVKIAEDATDENGLIESVQKFKEKHGIRNLDYCPQVAKILRDKVGLLRKAAKEAKELIENN